MPTLCVERDLLFAAIGRSYTDTEFDELCFEFGIELDEVTSERDEAVKAMSGTSSSKLSDQKIALLSATVIYKIDMPANRYDLLCVEGLARALRIFLGTMTEAPVYRSMTPAPPQTPITLTVRKPNVDTVRPFIVAAVLRNMTLTPARYASFIDLQDQLHRNLCRQRTLVAIGTHDLDTVVGPHFVYDARTPESIRFTPLTSPHQEFTAAALLEHYETDATCKHLKPYVPIIKESSLYPVVLDSQESVLSLPPIINGNQSKITLDTQNVLIECTATDLTKANIVLDTMVCMFSEYCAIPYTSESVHVMYVDADDAVVHQYTTPLLSTRCEQASVAFCNSLIGIEIDATAMRDLCQKVQLGPAVLLDNDTILQVQVPPTRSDILHAVDIAEDVGIAYGYNNIVKRIPATNTVGGEQPLNTLGDLLRLEIAGAGYTEILTHGLCSLADNFTNLRRPISAAVSLSNPSNVEYQVVRTTLLPGLLKTLQHNKSASFAGGFKVFEISDVVLPDATHVVTETIVGARNRRRLAAVYAGPSAGFEIIHGLVDRIMTLVEIAPSPEYLANSVAAKSNSDEESFRVAREGWRYSIAELDANGVSQSIAGTFFPGRAADILLTTPDATASGAPPIVIGTFGILHPDVLMNFDIHYPASCIEMDLEALM